MISDTFSPKLIADFLKEKELVYHAERYAERVVLIEEYEDKGLYEIAQEISARFPVQVFFSDMSLCVKRGSKSCWFMPKELLKTTHRARDVVSLLGASGGQEPPYGIGACARKLLTWLGAEQRPSPDFESLISHAEGGQHYKKAITGVFDRFDYKQYDLSSAYWQVVKRMPSPYVYDARGRVKFANPSPEVASRWKALKQAVEPCKPLRLAIVGRMLGGNASRCFFKGELQMGRGIGAGPLPQAARLAIRSIYEACYLAAISEESPYCNVDSVITASPTVWAWDKMGLDYKREPSHGDVEIRAVGAYRIGDKVTELFDDHALSPIFETKAPSRFVSTWLIDEA